MATYKYVAKSSNGQTAKGTVEAKDSKEAVEVLRKKELIIVTLEPLKKIKGQPTQVHTTKRVKADDLVIFSRQLSTVVEAGIPLVNALDIIAEQMEKVDLQNRIVKIRDDVEAGASLSEAMSKDKGFFSTFFVSMVKAGESSGKLDEILERLAVYLEKASSLQKKVTSAMIYPIIVSFMSISITLLLLLKVIPVFKDIYSGFDAKLPVPTQILIVTSDFLMKYFFVMCVISGIAVYVISRYAKTTKGRRLFDRILVKTPIFGPIVRRVAISKFTRTFATLVKSGVPILNSLDIVGKTAGNILIEEAVENVKNNVRDGENIATPLSKVPIFPPMVVRMINVGEKTGELEKMLTKVSDFYDVQVDAAVSGLTSLIEPILIAFLGIVVGGIVICMFLPILQISSIIKA